MKYEKKLETPQELQPREKMFETGPRNLRDDELLAIILNTGYKGMDVKTLSKMLIKDFGLKGIFTSFSDPEEIMEKASLPPVKSCTLATISEIVRRINQKDSVEINSAGAAYEYFSDLAKAKKEQVRVALLSPQNIVFYNECAAFGAGANVDCSLLNIFHPPVRFYAQRIIIAHNHPDGEADPSENDKEWHKNLLEIADKLEIEIVDHLIIGSNGYYSFAENEI